MKNAVLRRLAIFVCAGLATGIGASSALLGSCGPFTDFTDAVFCPFVLEIFYLGITTGTTATTYDPASPVSRLQMAAFLSRTVDAALKRGSRRAALDQFWTSMNATVLGFTTVGGFPQYPASDGTDIWVPTLLPFNVARVRASDGKLLETWTAEDAEAALPAMGRVLVTGQSIPGRLSSIDPSQPAGVATLVASNLPGSLFGIAFDGSRVWVAGQTGAVGIVTPGPTIPWTVTTVTTGFSAVYGAIFDGANVWVTDQTLNKLLKLDANGAILQTMTVGGRPLMPVFDGASFWVPGNFANTVSVVRASTGVLLQTLTGNGLSGPTQAVFDGQRILVTNQASTTVSLWKAADLSPLGSFDLGSQPLGACSDGVNFWVAMNDTGQVARF
ncbi:MAG TPA: hypothetical protein VKG01_21585 [Thermoanaerobaculia bacterium]|nr:hypothetical protein [Thermoanaerobaculia bacterium]